MAVTKFSATTGNWTSAGTWSDCDSTSENDSEAASAVPPTAGGSTSDSSTFTPGAITIDGIAIKLATRATSPAGTISVLLRTGGADVAGTTVTVNVSLLPAVGTSVTPGGWVFFKFATPVTLLAATAYLVRVTTTNSSQVTLYSASANNWSRQLRVSGASASAPTTGDKLIIGGDLTVASGLTSYTVTYDVTAATVWGASAAGQAIAVGLGGTLSQQVTASTAYLLNFLGRFLVSGGGAWSMAGNSAMPSTSSLICTAQNAVNVDCGFEWGSQCTVSLSGNPLTYVSTKLAADAAANATSLTTVDNTGWPAVTLLGIASTTQTASQCESKTTSAVSGTTLTIPALTNAHSGTSNANGNIRAEVVNLNRNIILQGNTSSLGSYINTQATSTVTLRYCEFTKLGSATTSKRGINVSVTTGSFDMQYCSIHDCIVTSSQGINVSATTGSNIIWSNNVTYNIDNCHFTNVATTGVQTISNNVCIYKPGFNQCMWELGDAGSTYTNNTLVGHNGSTNFGGMDISESLGAIGTCSGNVFHSHVSFGLVLDGLLSGTIASCTSWRNSNYGLYLGFNSNIRGPIVISNFTAFGNATANINLAFASPGVLFTGCTLNAGATQTCPIGVRLLGNGGGVNGAGINYFDTCTFGATTTHSTGDFSFATQYLATIYLSNCLLNSSTPLANLTNLTPYSRISSQKHQQTTGSHRTWVAEGLVSTDTAIYDTSPSQRLTPAINSGSGTKLQSAYPGMGFLVPVQNGSAPTVSVKVRESVAGDGTAYNGTHIRLLVRKNVAAGILADTVLATATAAATGAFQTLSGTPSAVTDDCVLEFFCDCDGTTGWANIDTYTVTGAYTGTLGTQSVWFGGYPTPGLNAGGGGGSVIGSSVVQSMRGRR